MEKIINEIKIIETDDGYRIEIKGNKEAIRRMLNGFAPFNFHGKGAPFRQGFGFGFWPSCWGGWWNPWEEQEKEKPGEQLAGPGKLRRFLIAHSCTVGERGNYRRIREGENGR